jgi:hypothetical protein
MVDLFRRLPRLLQDRWANFAPDCPKTVRLTVRYVSEHPEDGNRIARHGGRSNSVTTSQQNPIAGKELFEASSLQEMSRLIQAAIEPLLRSVLLRIHLNVTRINVCLADFQALPGASPATGNNSFFQLCSSQRDYGDPCHFSFLRKDLDLRSSQFDDSRTKPSPSQQQVALFTSRCTKRVASPCLTYDSLDPAVLEELPPDIAQEVRSALEGTKQKQKKQCKSPKTLDQYFAPRPRQKKSS